MISQYRSKKGRMGDAQALKGEEGRGKLRKAAGIRKQELIRRCPNGATRYLEEISSVAIQKRTQGTETSKYLEEEKTTVIAPVVASESAIAQTFIVKAMEGLQDYIIEAILS